MTKKTLLAVDEDYINYFLAIGSRGMGKNTIIQAQADAQKMVEEARGEVAMEIVNYIEDSSFNDYKEVYVEFIKQKYLGG